MATNFNPSKYGMVPKYLFDAMYSAPTAASGSNPFITQADLDAAIGLNNELSEVLANGNTTGGNNIIISDGDLITGSGGVIEMDFGSDAYWAVTTDSGTYATPYVYVDPNGGVLGSSIGVFVVSDVATIATNYIQLYTNLISINHDTEFRVTTPLVSITGANDVDITATANNLDLTATAGDVNITSGATITGIGGTGVAFTATTGSVAITSSAGTVDITTVLDDINITSGVNLVMAGDGVNLSATVGALTLVSTTAASMQAPEWVFANGTPAAALTDAFKMYSADIVAGNAAPHFQTEGGAVIKIYQETAAIAAAAFVTNTSGIVDDTATFGGYTIGQIVAALKAFGQLA